MTIEFSYGKIDEDSPVAPIKVDSGEYAGTVYRYTNMKLEGEVSLTFQVDLELMIRDGSICKKIEKFDTRHFYDTTAIPILRTIISDFAKKLPEVESDSLS